MYKNEKCVCCGNELKIKRISKRSKFCSSKCQIKYKDLNKKIFICLYCKNEFTGENNSKFCSVNCRNKFYEVKKSNNLQKQHNGKLPICKECGIAYIQLSSHFQKKHNITYNDYIKKWNPLPKEITPPQLKEFYSKKISGNKNPGYQHGGKLSPYSKNFIGYENKNADEKIKQIYKKVMISRKENNNDSTQIDYYTSRGFTIEEAQKKLSERQSTFSLEKCIEKYGEEEGKKKWNERQNKWQNNLKSKSPEEIERINRSKFKDSGYSKISQELFWSIDKKINLDIYFAEKNKEFCVMVHNNTRVRFLDFYIPSLKKCIEFDGDYWHGEKRGNQQRDMLREQEILETIPDIKILRVKEKDYKKDRNKIIEECLNFIND